MDSALEKVYCKNIGGVEGEGFLVYRVKNIKFRHIEDFSHFWRRNQNHPPANTWGKTELSGVFSWKIRKIRKKLHGCSVM